MKNDKEISYTTMEEDIAAAPTYDEGVISGRSQALREMVQILQLRMATLFINKEEIRAQELRAIITLLTQNIQKLEENA